MFTSQQMQDGVSQNQVARLLGKSSAVATDIHTHLVPQNE
jgi:site-specific recombinase XerD